MVLVVTIFVCSEGRGEEVASVKWYIENKKENKVEK